MRENALLRIFHSSYQGENTYEVLPVGSSVEMTIRLGPYGTYLPNGTTCHHYIHHFVAQAWNCQNLLTDHHLHHLNEPTSDH